MRTDESDLVYIHRAMRDEIPIPAETLRHIAELAYIYAVEAENEQKERPLDWEGDVRGELEARLENIQFCHSTAYYAQKLLDWLKQPPEAI